MEARSSRRVRVRAEGALHRPVKRVPDGDTLPDRAPAERRTKARRVLPIEDSADARERHAADEALLELAGHVVYDAADGPAVSKLLETMHPDVGIIDIGLPRMNGYQVARRIRDLPHGRDMLLLALTGYGSPADAHAAAAHGFDHHLVKPVRPGSSRSPAQLGRAGRGAAVQFGTAPAGYARYDGVWRSSGPIWKSNRRD